MSDVARTIKHGTLALIDGAAASVTVTFMDGGLQAQLLNAPRAPIMHRGAAQQWMLLDDAVYDVSFSLTMIEILGTTTGTGFTDLNVIEILKNTNNNTVTLSSTSAAGIPKTIDLKWTITNPAAVSPNTEVVTFPKFYAETLTVDEGYPNKISVTGKCLTIPTVAIT